MAVRPIKNPIKWCEARLSGVNPLSNHPVNEMQWYSLSGKYTTHLSLVGVKESKPYVHIIAVVINGHSFHVYDYKINPATVEERGSPYHMPWVWDIPTPAARAGRFFDWVIAYSRYLGSKKSKPLTAAIGEELREVSRRMHEIREAWKTDPEFLSLDAKHNSLLDKKRSIENQMENEYTFVQPTN